MACENKSGCKKYLRRGEQACVGCTTANAEPATTAADTEEEARPYSDEYGNTGAHLYRIRLCRTDYADVEVVVAADDAYEAEDRANDLDGVDYEEYDSEYSSEIAGEEVESD